jgi:predicted O-linked N-acetylglucosamine transferase (SPINDLY family)
MKSGVSAKLAQIQRLLASNQLQAARSECISLAERGKASAGIWSLLGQINERMGLYGEAVTSFRHVKTLAPNDLNARFMLGSSLLSLHRHQEAADEFRELLRQAPKHAAAMSNLGAALHADGRHAEAQRNYEAALAINPQDLSVNYNLGLVLKDQRLFVAAEHRFRVALALAPDFADTYNSLGFVLMEQGRFDAAEPVLRHALQLQPRHAYACYNLGTTLHSCQRFCEAAACFQSALKLKPDFADAARSLGTALLGQGLPKAAADNFRLALDIDPNHWSAHSNLLLTLHYLPETSQSDLFAEHCEWARRHVSIIDTKWPLANRSDAHRRLRIGYLSPDFRTHSVAFFLDPLLSHHDRERFEVYGYSATTRPDSVTERFKGYCRFWRDVSRLGDREFIDAIRGDQLDILVDLAGHSGGGRLRLTGQRLAPIQVTYLGYPDTTGVPAIDYRITDAWADPAGTDNLCSERLVRLSGGFLCYSPILPTPEPGELPMRRQGVVTFGSFNNLAKISAPVVALWSKILRMVPESRLLLKAKSLADEETRQRMKDLFVAHGIAEQRLVLRGWSTGAADHLSQYTEVDIAVDTFPYNGTTTTCEAMWMGVPVVTLAGSTHVGRVGVSLLSAAGLSEFVASSEDEYCDIASRLARDPSRLADLRSHLRSRIHSSPLCDALRMAREVEAIYQSMWEQWCIEHERDCT